MDRPAAGTAARARAIDLRRPLRLLPGERAAIADGGSLRLHPAGGLPHAAGRAATAFVAGRGSVPQPDPSDRIGNVLGGILRVPAAGRAVAALMAAGAVAVSAGNVVGGCARVPVGGEEPLSLPRQQSLHG